jgi:type IV pilus assembly protein PilC
MVVKMIKIGEESGQLSVMLNYLAEFYEGEMKENLNKAISMLEPVIIVILALIIGFLVVSVMMPMFDIYSYI